MFTIGTGIGGAVVERAKLCAVPRGTALGQLGHIVVDLGGANCVCGRRGCVETLSSGTALRRHIAEGGFPVSTSVDDLLAARDAGDEAARNVLLAWARPLRAAIDATVAMFDPDIVLLGGGLGSAAATALADCPALAAWYQCEIAPALLGDDAGMIGAGLLWRCAGMPSEPRPPRPTGGKRAVLINEHPGQRQEHRVARHRRPHGLAVAGARHDQEYVYRSPRRRWRPAVQPDTRPRRLSGGLVGGPRCPRRHHLYRRCLVRLPAARFARGASEHGRCRGNGGNLVPCPRRNPGGTLCRGSASASPAIPGRSTFPN